MSFRHEDERTTVDEPGGISIGGETTPLRPSNASVDPTLEQALRAMVIQGLLIDHRLIGRDDAFTLLADERASMSARVLERQRASGAARIVARKLLQRLGCGSCALPIGPTGAPVWPEGISGSLAHDERVAIAVAGKRGEVGSVGIDIEPAVMLAPDVLDLIATPRERQMIAHDPYGGGLLFTAKEAVYKAVHPLDLTFLDYHDIEVDLAGRTARISNGRVVELHFCLSTHLVALAKA